MELIAKVVGMNTSDGVYNLSVTDKANETYNLKISKDNISSIHIGDTYLFEYEDIEGTERTTHRVTSFVEATKLPLTEKDEALRSFYSSSPMSLEVAKKEIELYLSRIENKVIHDITEALIKKYEEDYFIYPAAVKLHHAYVGGLAYHSIGMLHLADGFINTYPYLQKDYIYAGIMLHDIGKTIELTGAINTEYSLKGQLLGHLVLGAMEIDQTAKELQYETANETLILEHMLISHHGQPQFGSAKRPMTPEALVLWYIDTIDSKFRVLGEELEKTEPGSFTDSIGVLDRSKIYKG